MPMKYLINMDDSIMNLQNEWDKEYINNSYMIEKTCGSPLKNKKIKMPHILDNSTTHDTDYD